MTVQHHPGDETLLAYAAGATDEAISLVIATHLALCPKCRASVTGAEAAGGALLSSFEPIALDSGALNSVLARLDEKTVVEPVRGRLAAAPFAVPEPLRSYLGGDLQSVRWTSVGPGISFKPLLKRGNSRAQLIRSRPGRGVGMHTHRGDEFTLVLTGGYTDATGHYLRGDLHATTPEIEHRPLADEGEDCIVLAVSDAPLKFRNLAVGTLGRLFGF